VTLQDHHPHPEQRGFSTEDIIWAVGIWSTILTLTPTNQNARKPRVVEGLAVQCDQAACLCMAPFAEAVPRIALTERSIAAQSLAISAAARPSA
jgi:hypothetical protein